MNQQQYPMEGIAEHLANQGRYGTVRLCMLTLLKLKELLL